MAVRNPHIPKLHSSYLFAEIAKRKKMFQERHPEVSLISLGIGDTTQPLSHVVSRALVSAAENLGTREGYRGYGPEQGILELRQRISECLYQNRVAPDEIYISDGSKPDIGRLQWLFGEEATIAVQNPTYPAYVGSSVIAGKTGSFDTKTQSYGRIVYLHCGPENDFFPDLNQAPRADILYFCSPNNPTGVAATRDQLRQLVAYAKQHKTILIYDSAYSSFIQDPDIPKSIYEIEGAHEVAIETGSFSKSAGFTGLRLGWTVVPKALYFEDGTSVADDWNQIVTTTFNGASNLAQAGALASLSPEGVIESQYLSQYYLENARILKEALEKKGLEVYGGIHSPYLWVDLQGHSSWKAFDYFLNEFHLITTPGVGFGSSGEGFLRLSAFCHREEVVKASLKQLVLSTEQ